MLPTGVAKTQTVFLAARENAASEIQSLAQMDVVACPDPNWTCASGALGSLSPPQAGDEEVEGHMAAITDDFLAEQQAKSWYGWFDFGDQDKHNCEADFHHGLFVEFLRTADPKHYRAAARMSRHFMDIDVHHFDQDPGAAGGVHAHTIARYQDRHTGGPLNACHCWVNGLVDYYCLTGDGRGKEVAEEIGGFLLRAMDADGRPFHRGDYHGIQFCSRDLGRILDYLCLLWELTGTTAYLDGAAKAFRCTLEAQLPEGDWYTLQLHPDATRPKTSMFAEVGGMCTAIVLGGLLKYQSVTGDNTAADAFLRGVDHMVHGCMTDERDGFRYGTYLGDGQAQYGPWASREHYHPFSTTEMLHWLVEAHRLTGRGDYLDQADRCLARLIAPESLAEWEHNQAQIHLPYYLHARRSREAASGRD